MERIKVWLGKGLNAWQIKMIALVFMTLDHLGSYGFEIPIFETHYTKLRLLGRIAMPLFLFVLTESIRHTRNRRKFLLRLYLGAVSTGLFIAATNYLFEDSVGRFLSSNIFFMYLFVAIYVILVEEIIGGIRAKNRKKILLGIAGTIGTFVPLVLMLLLDRVSLMDYGASLEMQMLFEDLLTSFLASPIHVEYTILFVAMGVLMYFAGDKYRKAAVLVLFSIFCYLGGKIGMIRDSFFCFVVGYPQYYMIMAVPFMLLYNGEKGRGSKYFFYCYYPLHRYAISVAVYIYKLITGA